MAIKLDDKKAIVAEVQEAAIGALSAVVADARGVTVGKITELRKQAREAGVWMKVVRNTLVRRAVSGTEFECLSNAFVGPTLIAFSKDNAKFELKGAAFNGATVSIDVLASLPTRNEAIARLMSTMKEAAAGKLVRTIAAVRDQKQA